MFIRCKNKVVESSQLILDGRYEDLLSHYKFNVEEALKKANIPEDCFKKLHPSMSEQQYYNFMAAIGDQISDPFTPIEIATTNPIESFSPPIFAAYSSRNGDIFIKRLAKYKKLIGPLSFKIDKDSKQLSITLTPSKAIFPTLFSSFIRICIFSGTFAQDDQRSHFPAEDHNDIPRQ